MKALMVASAILIQIAWLLFAIVPMTVHLVEKERAFKEWLNSEDEPAVKDEQ